MGRPGSLSDQAGGGQGHRCRRHLGNSPVPRPPVPQFPRTPSCPAAELGLCGNRRKTGRGVQKGGPHLSPAGCWREPCHLAQPPPRTHVVCSGRQVSLPGSWSPVSQRAALTRPPQPPPPSLCVRPGLGRRATIDSGSLNRSRLSRSLGDMPGLEPTCQDSVGLSQPPALKLPGFPGAWRLRV